MVKSKNKKTFLELRHKPFNIEKIYQMTYISEPVKGLIYIAEPSRKGTKRLLWSVMPEKGNADIRIELTEVPYAIKRQAYRRRYYIRQFLKDGHDQEKASPSGDHRPGLDR